MRRALAPVPIDRSRRHLLTAAAATVITLTVRPLHAAERALPFLPALDTYLAGRTPSFTRIALDLPSLADNGFAVPMRVVVAGPFAPGPFVRAVRIFSETNPVPDVAVFEFPVPIERIELDTRIRLAGTQRVIATAEMSDATVLATSAEVIVTLAGCMDGT